MDDRNSYNKRLAQCHLIISGDVQGVGFRAWALGQAQDLKITGWVKNRDDGAVEIVAEGSRESLNELVKRCQKGPGVGWVKNVDIQWQDATNKFSLFDIVY